MTHVYGRDSRGMSLETDFRAVRRALSGAISRGDRYNNNTKMVIRSELDNA